MNAKPVFGNGRIFRKPHSQRTSAALTPPSLPRQAGEGRKASSRWFDGKACWGMLVGAALIGLSFEPAHAEGQDMHAHDMHSHHMHSQGMQPAGAQQLEPIRQDHAQHAHDHASHMLPSSIKRSLASYTLPDVQLTGTDGKRVRLADELDTRTPLLVNFIFTSCTAICPLTSAVFAQVQDKLAANGKPFRLLSISIDPEQDTPARLQDYARKFGAGADWHFLTGDADSVVAVQRAFKAWRGGKQNHAPITYLRVAPGTPWLRYEGLVDADTLVEDYQHFSTGLKTVQR